MIRVEIPNQLLVASRVHRDCPDKFVYIVDHAVTSWLNAAPLEGRFQVKCCYDPHILFENENDVLMFKLRWP